VEPLGAAAILAPAAEGARSGAGEPPAAPAASFTVLPATSSVAAAFTVASSTALSSATLFIVASSTIGGHTHLFALAGGHGAGTASDASSTAHAGRPCGCLLDRHLPERLHGLLAGRHHCDNQRRRPDRRARG
jgi:hypothetical protein